MIAAAIGQTENILLGTGVEILYQSHPVRLAAELIQLDHMARGRMLFGFGAGGTPTDGALYGLDLSKGESQARSKEALEIILQCWSDEGPVDFDGKFWTIRKPIYNERYDWHLKPFSPPEPRIAFAGFMPNSGSLRTAGEHGYIPMSFNVAPDQVGMHWDSVKVGAAISGRSADRSQWRQIREIYVADTKEQARKDIVEGFAARFWDDYFMIAMERIGIIDMFRRQDAPSDTPANAAYLVDHGTWFVGDPDSVTDQIVEQYELTKGFGTLLQIGFDYSTESAREGWFRSMELLATEVMPQVKKRLRL
jgi:alkanesulfonate monooxygenase SsuD/methylene tetrahydromethanopterin reductase-like flavin-dependent oxidoreductase (luciferase family)